MFASLKKIFSLFPAKDRSKLVILYGMIHDGCTTSLDAIGSGIPILNFKMVNDSFEQCVAILKKKVSEKLKRQSVADTSPSLHLMRRDSMIRSKKIGLAI